MPFEYVDDQLIDTPKHRYGVDPYSYADAAVGTSTTPTDTLSRTEMYSELMPLDSFSLARPENRIKVLGKTVSRSELESTEAGQALLKLRELREQGDRRGFVEAISDVGAKDLPFVGDIVGDVLSLSDTYRVANTFKDMADGKDVSSEDLVKAALFQEDQERKAQATKYGMAGDIVRAMPGYMIETGFYMAAAAKGATALGFAGAPGAAAGAAGSVALTAGKRIIGKVVRGKARNAAARFIASTAGKRLGAKYIVDAAVLGTVGVAAGVAHTAMDTAIDAAINVAMGDDPLASRAGAERSVRRAQTTGEVNTGVDNMLALGSETVERMSEQVGEGFTELLSPIGGKILSITGRMQDSGVAGGRKLANHLLKRGFDEFDTAAVTGTAGKAARKAALDKARSEAAVLSIFDKRRQALMGAWIADKAADSLDKYPLEYVLEKLKRVGYDGFLSEMLEERWGGFASGLLGLEGDEAGLRNALSNMWWDNSDQFWAEAIAFATPLAVVGAAHRGRLAAAGVNTTKTMRDIRTVHQGLLHTESPSAYVEYAKGGGLTDTQERDLRAQGTPEDVLESIKRLSEVQQARPTGLLAKAFDYGLSLAESLATGSMVAHSKYRAADYILAEAGTAGYVGAYGQALSQARRIAESQEKLPETATEEQKKAAAGRAEAKARAAVDRAMLDVIGTHRGTKVLQEDILKAAGIDSTSGLTPEQVVERLNSVAGTEDSPIVQHEISDAGITVYSLRANGLPGVENFIKQNAKMAEVLSKHGFAVQTQDVPEAGELPSIAFGHKLELSEKDLGGIAADPLSMNGWRLAQMFPNVLLGSQGQVNGFERIGMLASRIQGNLRNGNYAQVFSAVGKTKDEADIQFALRRGVDGGIGFVALTDAAAAAARSGSTSLGRALRRVDAYASQMKEDPGFDPYNFLKTILAPNFVMNEAADMEIVLAPLHQLRTQSAKRMLQMGAKLGGYGITVADLAEGKNEAAYAEVALSKMNARKDPDSGLYTTSLGAVNGYNPVTRTSTVYASPSESGYDLWEDVFEATLKRLHGGNYKWSTPVRQYIENVRANLNRIPVDSELQDTALALLPLVEASNNNSIEAPGKLYGTLRLGYVPAPYARAVYRTDIAKMADYLRAIPGYADFVRELDAVHGVPVGTLSDADIAKALVPWRPYDMSEMEARALYIRVTDAAVAQPVAAAPAKAPAKPRTVAPPAGGDDEKKPEVVSKKRKGRKAIVAKESLAKPKTARAAKPAEAPPAEAPPAEAPPAAEEDLGIVGGPDMFGEDINMDAEVGSTDDYLNAIVGSADTPKDSKPTDDPNASISEIKNTLQRSPMLFSAVLNTMKHMHVPPTEALALLRTWGLDAKDLKELSAAATKAKAAAIAAKEGRAVEPEILGAEDTESYDISEDMDAEGNTSEDDHKTSGEILSVQDKLRAAVQSGPIGLFRRLAGLRMGRDAALHSLVDLMSAISADGVIPSGEALRNGTAKDLNILESSEKFKQWISSYDFKGDTNMREAAKVLWAMGPEALVAVATATQGAHEMMTAELSVVVSDKGVPQGVRFLRRHLDNPVNLMTQARNGAIKVASTEASRDTAYELVDAIPNINGTANPNDYAAEEQAALDSMIAAMNYMSGNTLLPHLVALRTKINEGDPEAVKLMRFMRFKFKTSIQGRLAADEVNQIGVLALADEFATASASTKKGSKQGSLLLDILKLVAPVRPSTTAFKPGGEMVYNIRMNSGLRQALSGGLAANPEIELMELLGARFAVVETDDEGNIQDSRERSRSYSDKELDADARRMLMETVYDTVVVKADKEYEAALAEYNAALKEAGKPFGAKVRVVRKKKTPSGKELGFPVTLEKPTKSAEGIPLDFSSSKDRMNKVLYIPFFGEKDVMYGVWMPRSVIEGTKNYEEAEQKMEEKFFELLPQTWGNLSMPQLSKRISALNSGATTPLFGVEGGFTTKRDATTRVFVMDGAQGLDGHAYSTKAWGDKLAVSSGGAGKQIHKAHTWAIDLAAGTTLFMKTKFGLGNTSANTRTYESEILHEAEKQDMDVVTDSDGVKINDLPKESLKAATITVNGKPVSGYIVEIPTESLYETTNLQYDSRSEEMGVPKPAINDAMSNPGAAPKVLAAANLVPDTVLEFINASGKSIEELDRDGGVGALVRDEYLSTIIQAGAPENLPQFRSPIAATIASLFRKRTMKVYGNSNHTQVMPSGGSVKTLTADKAAGLTLSEDQDTWTKQKDGTYAKRNRDGEVVQLTWVGGKEDPALQPMQVVDDGRGGRITRTERMRINLRTIKGSKFAQRGFSMALEANDGFDPVEALSMYGEAMAALREAKQAGSGIEEARTRLNETYELLRQNLRIIDPVANLRQDLGSLKPILSDLYDSETLELKTHELDSEGDTIIIPGQVFETSRTPGGPSAHRVARASAPVGWEIADDGTFVPGHTGMDKQHPEPRARSGADMDGDTQNNHMHYVDEDGMIIRQEITREEIQTLVAEADGDMEKLRAIFKRVVKHNNKVAANRILDAEIAAQEQMTPEARQKAVNTDRFVNSKIEAPMSFTATLKDNTKVTITKGQLYPLSVYKEAENAIVRSGARDPKVRRLYEHLVRSSTKVRGISVWMYNGLQDVVYGSGAHMIAKEAGTKGDPTTLVAGNRTLTLDATKETFKSSYDHVRTVLGDIVNVIIDDVKYNVTGLLHLTESELAIVVSALMLKQHDSEQSVMDHFENVMRYMESPLVRGILKHQVRTVLDVGPRRNMFEMARADEALQKSLGLNEAQFNKQIDDFEMLVSVSDRMSKVLGAQALYHKKPTSVVRLLEISRVLSELDRYKEPSLAARLAFVAMDDVSGDAAYRKAKLADMMYRTQVFSRHPAMSIGFNELRDALEYNTLGDIPEGAERVAVPRYRLESVATMLDEAMSMEAIASLIPQEDLEAVASLLKDTEKTGQSAPANLINKVIERVYALADAENLYNRFLSSTFLQNSAERSVQFQNPATKAGKPFSIVDPGQLPPSEVNAIRADFAKLATQFGDRLEVAEGVTIDASAIPMYFLLSSVMSNGLSVSPHRGNIFQLADVNTLKRYGQAVELFARTALDRPQELWKDYSKSFLRERRTDVGKEVVVQNYYGNGGSVIVRAALGSKFASASEIATANKLRRPSERRTGVPAVAEAPVTPAPSADNPSIDIDTITEYNGIPVRRSETGSTHPEHGGIAPARLQRDASGAPLYIEISPDAIRETFRNKQWTTPRVSGVLPLVEDAFLTVGEWAALVLEHEFQHTKFPRVKSGEPGYAENENAITQAAAEALGIADRVYGKQAPVTQAPVTSTADVLRLFPQEQITLDPDTHIYTVGGRALVSVTTLLSRLFPFDAKGISEALAARTGESAERIRELWDLERDRGTALHEELEAVLNGDDVPGADAGILELREALRNTHGDQILTELRVWSDETGIAGSIDILARNADGTFDIYDLKTMRGDENPHTPGGKYQSTKFGPSKAEKHRIQLLGYAKILGEQGIRVRNVYIIPVDRRTGESMRNPTTGKILVKANPTQSTRALYAAMLAKADISEAPVTEAPVTEAPGTEALIAELEALGLRVTQDGTQTAVFREDDTPLFTHNGYALTTAISDMSGLDFRVTRSDGERRAIIVMPKGHMFVVGVTGMPIPSTSVTPEMLSKVFPPRIAEGVLAISKAISGKEYGIEALERDMLEMLRDQAAEAPVTEAPVTSGIPEGITEFQAPGRGGTTVTVTLDPAVGWLATVGTVTSPISDEQALTYYRRSTGELAVDEDVVDKPAEVEIPTIVYSLEDIREVSEYEVQFSYDGSRYRASNKADGIISSVLRNGGGEVPQGLKALVGTSRAAILSRKQETPEDIQEPETESKREIKPASTSIIPGMLMLGDGKFVKASAEQAEAVERLESELAETLKGGSKGRTTLLVGAAGTGKTTLIREVLRRLRLRTRKTGAITMATPTHQASGVLAWLTSFWGMDFKEPGSKPIHLRPEVVTTASLLGQRRSAPKPGSALDGFMIQIGDSWYIDPETAEQLPFPARILQSSLIIIDEVSMLSRVEYDLLKKWQALYGHDILFMGDSPQLPAVEIEAGEAAEPRTFTLAELSAGLPDKLRAEREAKTPGMTAPRLGVVFTEVPAENTIELKTVMRQAEGNPIIKILNSLRDVILNPDAKKADALIKLPVKEEIKEDGTGYVSLPDMSAVFDAIGTHVNQELFERDPYALRGYSATNAGVAQRNREMFDRLFPEAAAAGERLAVGTLLKAYTNAYAASADPGPKMASLIRRLSYRPHYNSDDLVVRRVGPKSKFGGEFDVFAKLEGQWVEVAYAVQGMPMPKKASRRLFMPANVEDVAGIIKEMTGILAEGRAKGAFKQVDEFSDMLDMFLNSLVTFGDIVVPGGRTYEKAFDYAYFSTIHKSQGSTNTVVILDADVDRSQFARYDKLQLLYVGLSRTSKLAFAITRRAKGHKMNASSAAAAGALLDRTKADISVPEYIEDFSTYGSNPQGVKSEVPEAALPESTGPESQDGTSASIAEAKTMRQLATQVAFAGSGSDLVKRGRINKQYRDLIEYFERAPYSADLEYLSGRMVKIVYDNTGSLRPDQVRGIYIALDRMSYEAQRELLDFLEPPTAQGTEEEMARGADREVLRDLGFTASIGETLHREFYNPAVAENRGNLIRGAAPRPQLDMPDTAWTASIAGYEAVQAVFRSSLLGQTAGPKVHQIVARDLNWMQNFMEKYRRLVGYDYTYWGVSGIVDKMVDVEYEVGGKKETFQRRKMFSKLRPGTRMAQADHQDILVLHNAVAMALEYLPNNRKGTYTKAELMSALNRASVFTDIALENEDILREALPHAAEEMLRRKADIEAAFLSDKTKRTPEGRQLALVQRLAAAGLVKYRERTFKQGEKTITIPESVVWAVPASLAIEVFENKYNNSGAKAMLMANGRKAEKLNPLALLESARKTLDKMREEVNARMPHIASEDGPFLAFRDKYIAHLTGPVGFLGNMETEITDRIKLELDKVQRDKSNELIRILALSETKKGGPRTLNEVSEKMLMFMFNVNNLEYSSHEDALARIATSDSSPEMAIAGIHSQMTYADVALNINAALNRRMMERALRKEDLNAPVNGVDDPLAVMKAIQSVNFQNREYSPRTLQRKYNTYDELYHETGKLPKNIGILDYVQKYYSDVAAAAMQRSAMNSLAVTIDPVGMPVVLFDPDVEFEGSKYESVLTEEAWGRQLYLLSEYLGVKPDSRKSVKENLRHLIHKHVSNSKAFSAIDSPYPSVTRIYAMTKGTNQEHILDMMSGGEVAALVKHALQSKYEDQYGILRTAEQLNNISKMMAMQASLFFFIAGNEGLLAGTSGRYLKDRGPMAWIEIGQKLKARHPEVMDMLEKAESLNITFGRIDNPMSLPGGYGAEGIKKLEDFMRQQFGADAARWSKYVTSLPGRQTEMMFDSFLNSAKLYMFMTFYNRAEAKAKAEGRKFDYKEELRDIANYIDNELGGMRLVKYSWLTPTMRRNLNLLMFSFPWTLAAWNAAGGGVLTGPLLKNYLTEDETKFILFRRLPIMLAGVLVALPAIAQMAAYVAGGGNPDDDDEFFMWNNEAGKKLHADITPLVRHFPGYKGDPTGRRRFYLRWGKQLYETQRWLENPVASFKSKLSQGARWAVEQSTGEVSGMGWDLGFKDQGLLGLVVDKDGNFAGSRIGHTAAKFLPFSISAWARTPDAAPLQFLGPISKGMSYTRAIEAYQGLLETWARKDTYSKVYNNPRVQANLEALGNEILDAVERNGYDPKKVLDTAKGNVTKLIYAEIFKALQAGDTRKMEELSRQLHRLNGKVDGVRRSVRARNKNYGLPAKLTDEQKAMLDEAFKRP